LSVLLARNCRKFPPPNPNPLAIAPCEAEQSFAETIGPSTPFDKSASASAPAATEQNSSHAKGRGKAAAFLFLLPNLICRNIGSAVVD
jgi:hypothetical protein